MWVLHRHRQCLFRLCSRRGSSHILFRDLDKQKLKTKGGPAKVSLSKKALPKSRKLNKKNTVGQL